MFVRLAILPNAVMTLSDSANAAPIGSDLECGALSSIIWVWARKRYVRPLPVIVNDEPLSNASIVRSGRAITVLDCS